ncbi:MAG: helix-turn-helix domain-containing protein [Flavobacteriales bacterium]|jgi:DNA-binding NarL/FixJ family response regulator
MEATMNTTDMVETAAAFVNSTGSHIFLTGKAGTGKTTFLRSLGERTHKRFAIVAPTGIAALNAGGVTIHSMFQLPLGTFLPDRTPSGQFSSDANIYTQFTLSRKHPISALKKQVLRSLDLLIIDEVSMLRADVLDAIDYRMRSVRGNFSKAFGGVQVLMIGDLFQLPPIVKDHEWGLLKRYYHSAHFFEAKALQSEGFVYIELDKIYRQSDQRFIDLLNHLRENQTTVDDIELLNTYYRPQSEQGEGIITLTTHNYKADDMNSAQLRRLNGHSFIYEAVVEDDFPESMFPLPQKLELKEGAQVMFVRNDSNGGRFFNGMLASVCELDEKGIKVRVIDSGLVLDVPREQWENKKYSVSAATRDLDEEVVGTFSQFPIKLAWAVTVHKSQGLTFDKAIIDVGQAFAPGQVYVALSRLRSLDGLILKTRIDPAVISNDALVVNFSKTKHAMEQLQQLLSERRVHYMHDLIASTFLFATLLRELDQLVKEGDDTAEFSDSSMKPILQVLREAVRAEDINTQKFVQQLQYLLQQGDQEGLRDRLEKGSGYYTALLGNHIAALLLHMQQLQWRTGVKSYLTLLGEVDQLLMKKYEDIQKSVIIIQGLLNRANFIDVSVIDRQRESLRRTWLDIAKSEAYVQRQSSPSNDAPKRKNAGKRPAGRAGKKDTVDHTLELFRLGKTIEEIAAERTLANGTIESHLTKAIAAGKLELNQYIADEDIAVIEAAIDEHGATGLRPVFDALEERFSFGKIRAVAASRGVRTGD